MKQNAFGLLLEGEQGKKFLNTSLLSCDRCEINLGFRSMVLNYLLCRSCDLESLILLQGFERENKTKDARNVGHLFVFRYLYVSVCLHFNLDFLKFISLTCINTYLLFLLHISINVSLIYVLIYVLIFFFRSLAPFFTIHTGSYIFISRSILNTYICSENMYHLLTYALHI